MAAARTKRTARRTPRRLRGRPWPRHFAIAGAIDAWDSVSGQLTVGARTFAVGTMVAVAGQATPIFWLGIMLIILFAVRLHWLPASGYGTWQHFVMPAFTLGVFLAPITMRLVRSGLIDVLSSDYVKTARAKGLAERAVVVKHAFRNACLPVITVLGLQFGQLLGGAIVTETVFAWPGVGTLMFDSVIRRDYPMVLTIVLFVGLVFVLVNLLVDSLYAVIDPRIRLADEGAA